MQTAAVNPYGAQIAGGKAELYVMSQELCFYSDIPWVQCTQAVDYQAYHWISRYPRPTSKLWNIRDLFTPGGWAMLALTFCIMIGFLRKTKMLFPLHSPMSLAREELPLVFTL